VKLLDGAYAESPAKPEAESGEKAENEPSSCAIVTTAIPEEKLDRVEVALSN
jgi:hypothetical protein